MYNKFSKIDNREKYSGKISLYFIVVALVVSAFVFPALLDNSKNYRSEISIIFIPKSEKAASESEKITENLKFLPTKLFFYKKLLRDNQNIKDEFLGFPDDKKKELWNKELKVKREGNSSIIDISITRKDPEEARTFSKSIALTLFNTASFYYDIKNDIDLRIIEEPIVHTGIKNSFLIALISLATGALASAIISLISYVVSEYLFIKKERIRFESERRIPEISFENKAEKPSRDEILGKKEKIEEYKYQEPLASVTGKKSSAPDNLPFIDEDYFRNNIIKAKGLKMKEEPVVFKTADKKEEAPDLHREPTQEELKKRLNQLLRGEL